MLLSDCCTLGGVCSRSSVVLGRVTAIAANASWRFNWLVYMFDQPETTHGSNLYSLQEFGGVGSTLFSSSSSSFPSGSYSEFLLSISFGAQYILHISVSFATVLYDFRIQSDTCCEFWISLEQISETNWNLSFCYNFLLFVLRFKQLDLFLCVKIPLSLPCSHFFWWSVP